MLQLFARAIEYMSADRTQGSIVLGDWPYCEGQAEAILILCGPERGHVWLDKRSAIPDDWEEAKEAGIPPRNIAGIEPLVRRGPYSFLAWYEHWIDDVLQGIDALYEEVIDSIFYSEHCD